MVFTKEDCIQLYWLVFWIDAWIELYTGFLVFVIKTMFLVCVHY